MSKLFWAFRISFFLSSCRNQSKTIFSCQEEHLASFFVVNIHLVFKLIYVGNFSLKSTTTMTSYRAPLILNSETTASSTSNVCSSSIIIALSPPPSCNSKKILEEKYVHFLCASPYGYLDTYTFFFHYLDRSLI